METKLESIKRQIEKMRETTIGEGTYAGERIGDMAKRTVKQPWSNTPAEAIVNTVLAMRQNWERTARPRYEAFRRTYNQIRTIHDLHNLLNSMSESEFCKKVLGMKIGKTGYWRYKMLKDMVDAFMTYQEVKGFKSDYEAMKYWAENCKLEDLKKDIIGKLNHVGIATLQNLRMCLGINTIKPDIHIKRVLQELRVGNDVGVSELISELTGYPCLELDQIFWHWDKSRHAPRIQAC